MKKNISIHDKYEPAMSITEQSEADAYFARCVEHCMSHGPNPVESARIERINLGFYAAFKGDETRTRVEKLFKATHPVLGSIIERGPVSVGDAIEIGRKLNQQVMAENAAKLLANPNPEMISRFLEAVVKSVEHGVKPDEGVNRITPDAGAQ